MKYFPLYLDKNIQTRRSVKRLHIKAMTEAGIITIFSFLLFVKKIFPIMAYAKNKVYAIIIPLENNGEK